MILTRIVVSALSGLVLGAAVLVIVLVGSTAFAWATGTRAFLPGIFEAWVTEENGMPAVNFVPNLWGMLAVVLATSAFLVLASLRKRGSGRSS
ncbi:hypothetical protein [Sinomonas gamaensis]|uniref:hypothetical protein n=1 Tax=Sinomonas gamaensis TaxID=2565624 RepID=UPI00110861E6|nr:hypothetical protein [Sinomonas gamaensis]